MLICRLENFDLNDIAASGQCFRLTPREPDTFRLIARERVLVIRPLGDSAYQFDCDGEEFAAIWADYFDLATDYGTIVRRARSGDAYLARAAARACGLRILKQEPWETLVSFIISQRKNIPAIRASIEALCRRFGAPLGEGLYGFPSPEALAAAADDDLAACALGYRLRYIRETARLVASGAVDLSALGELADAALLEALLRLPGVGMKVASCVMLFAYHRLDACPVDVWIQRVIDEQYGGQSPFERYHPYAGVMQQYLFFYRRAER